MTFRNRFARAAASRRGFTLVEIILVVVIILTLVSVVGPRIANKGKKAKRDSTIIQMKNVEAALQNFEIHASRFPTTEEGLDALVKKPSELTEDEWPDKYMNVLPKDSWGTAFDYKYPSEHGLDFDLISAGPDKKMNTEDDITNYTKESAGK